MRNFQESMRHESNKDWELEKETKIHSQFSFVKDTEIILFFYVHIT